MPSKKRSTSGEKRIVIVGGGFGGIRAALNLSDASLKNVHIVLINKAFHFEYSPVLYKVVVGHSPFEVCIPLPEIFSGKQVEIVADEIETFDLKRQILRGKTGSNYRYDYLVLALGSETAYFGIPGLKEKSFSFKSIHDALRLKNHIHQIFSEARHLSAKDEVSVHNLVVVGGGPTGVELAGDLAIYVRHLAGEHGLKPSIVTVNLIEAASRVLPSLPEGVSRVAARRLHHLGVNIFVSRRVVGSDIDTIYMEDMEMSSRTIIWTAGVQSNHVLREVSGLSLDKRGRVMVDSYLRVRGSKNVFVIGDGASTPYAGLAQTALRDGAFVAAHLIRHFRRRQFKKYTARQPGFVIPIGPGWGLALVNKIRVHGMLAWWLRQLVDIRFFHSILSWSKARDAWQDGRALYESCPTCGDLLSNKRLTE